MQPIIALIAAAAAAAPAQAAAAPAETAIPYVRSNGILDWQADGDRGLYIQSITGEWYYARTRGRCGRLNSAYTIGFETRGPDQLDRFGTLRIEGWRCALASVTRAEAPAAERD